MDNVTTKTRDLVTRWQRAKKSVQHANARLTEASNELAEANKELGTWLVPEGQNDEPFNLWFGSGILQAKRSTTGDFSVHWRREPDGKDRIEFGL